MVVQKEHWWAATSATLAGMMVGLWVGHWDDSTVDEWAAQLDMPRADEKAGPWADATAEQRAERTAGGKAVRSG